METMTLEQVRDRLQCTDETELSAEACYALGEVIAAHLREREAAVSDALDYVPGELDKTAPERIWLQIDTFASSNDRSEPWPGADDVTWQDESIGGLEIQYVRADLVVPMLASARVPAAWMTDDGRVISARQKETALRDGGASASSVVPYAIPLTAAPKHEKEE